jgi:hypothetical protein
MLILKNITTQAVIFKYLVCYFLSMECMLYGAIELVNVNDLYDECPEVEDPNEAHYRTLPVQACSAVVTIAETMC